MPGKGWRLTPADVPGNAAAPLRCGPESPVPEREGQRRCSAKTLAAAAFGAWTARI